MGIITELHARRFQHTFTLDENPLVRIDQDVGDGGIGEKRLEFVQAMRERGILVRDRNSDPGCSGCVRITLGTSNQTDSLIAALREICCELAIPSALSVRGAK